MDNNFTQKLRKWLETEAADRDLMAGAMLLLQLTGNRNQYAAICMNPPRYADMLEYQLQKHYNFRVAELTMAQLEEMSKEAASKTAAIGITMDPESGEETAATFSGYGKRPNHDSLPPEAQQAYRDNLDIRRKMQQLHLQIRTQYATLTNCTASDVYALVTELLRFEKLYTDNWALYDSATPVLIPEA